MSVSLIGLWLLLSGSYGLFRLWWVLWAGGLLVFGLAGFGWSGFFWVWGWVWAVGWVCGWVGLGLVVGGCGLWGGVCVGGLSVGIAS